MIQLNTDPLGSVLQLRYFQDTDHPTVFTKTYTKEIGSTGGSLSLLHPKFQWQHKRNWWIFLYFPKHHAGLVLAT